MTAKKFIHFSLKSLRVQSIYAAIMNNGFEFFEIKHSKTGKSFLVNQFWLRDHCRCANCYNKTTKQRKYNLLDIPEDVKCVESKYLQNGDLLEVKWSDGHEALYDVNFLYSIQKGQVIFHYQTSSLRTLWNQALILENEADLRFPLPKLILHDSIVRLLLQSLIRYGIVFIDNVPTTTAMTEMAIRRIFPVMKTFFGEMYTFSDRADHADTAYTKEFIGLHTDNTYFCDAAGLQALHCIEHVNGSGGENFFVDGLYAAMELKRQHPRAFDVLSHVSVPAEYIEDGQYHKHSAPLIRIDSLTGEFIQLRLNLYDRAAFDTIDQHEMREFYESFRKFLSIINDMTNRWTLKLRPGTIVIFDNWRICHARHEYTGSRAMTGCYVQRTDYLSRARIEGIIE